MSWKSVGRLIELIVWPLLLFLIYERNELVDELNVKSLHTEFGRRLLILMPFTSGDIPKMIENISRWSHIKPFFKKPTVRPYVDFIFYFNLDFVQDGAIREPLNDLRLKLVEMDIFNSVKVITANHDHRLDSYPGGVTDMFFEAFDIPTIRDSYSFMYWMEPDNFPIRTGWLDKLYQLASMTGSHYWMIGSIRRGVFQEQNEYSTFKDHINGNAVYRLDDPNFHSFLHKVRYDYNQVRGKHLKSFDIALHLVYKEMEPFHLKASIAHKFVYTNLVMNVYRTQTRVSDVLEQSSETYLLHGRYIIFS
jgi:hypothetical protein